MYIIYTKPLASTSELLSCTLHIVIKFSGLRSGLIPNQIFILQALLEASPTLKSGSLETLSTEDISILIPNAKAELLLLLGNGITAFQNG